MTSSLFSAHWTLLFATLFVLTVIVSLLPSRAMAAPMPLSGFAWSAGGDAASGASGPMLGWISFSGPGYGVSEESTNGELSGYAWSSNIGWITFNNAELSGCPSGSCTARYHASSGTIRGWARACSAFVSGCSGALNTNSGGWDGWIALSGTAADGSSYAVTQDANCNWSGYAWGSDTLGAISMRGTASNGSPYGVSCTNTSSGSVTLTANPTAVPSGDASSLTWTSTGGMTSCNFPVGSPLYDPSGYPPQNSSTGLSTGPLMVDTSYNLTCTGPSGSASGTTVVAIIVPPPPTASITASPTRVSSGATTDNVTVSWNATNVNSCSVSRNGVAGWRTSIADASKNVNDSSPDMVTTQTRYDLTCGTATATTVVNLLPGFIEF